LIELYQKSLKKTNNAKGAYEVYLANGPCRAGMANQCYMGRVMPSAHQTYRASPTRSLDKIFSPKFVFKLKKTLTSLNLKLKT
jgi:hypothetical protein